MPVISPISKPLSPSITTISLAFISPSLIQIEIEKQREMKRQSIQIAGESPQESVKKQRLEAPPSAAPDLGEDLVFEVLKRADDRTLGRAACVSRRWREMAEDERLWEAVCTPHWASMGCGKLQLRSVVLALGGFRRLHSLYMVPLRPSSSGATQRLPLPFGGGGGGGGSATLRRPSRWGKDEVQLSLSLLSIGFFERMSRGFRPGAGGCG